MSLLRPQHARRVVVLLISMATLLGFGAFPLVAASDGTVSATVVAEGACITVEATSIDFGTNPFSVDTGDSSGDESVIGTPDSAASSGASYALNNCSSSPQDLMASGTNAENSGGTVVWTLDGDVADVSGGICNDPDGSTDRYRMVVVNDENNDNIADGSEFAIALTTSARTIPGALGVAGGVDTFVINFVIMPCTGSGGAGEIMNSAITYVATLS